jgi:hypothetical protein
LQFTNQGNITTNKLEELKQLANEVLGLAQKKVGTTEYYYAYNKIRQRVQEVRTQRKANRAYQVCITPRFFNVCRPSETYTFIYYRLLLTQKLPHA